MSRELKHPKIIKLLFPMGDDWACLVDTKTILGPGLCFIQDPNHPRWHEPVEETLDRSGG